MLKKITKLVTFELKRNFVCSKSWLGNCLFLLINIVIFPFTLNFAQDIIQQSFLSVILTSILLAVVLIGNHVFDEDHADGTLVQYRLFGLSLGEIFLSKVIVVCFELILVISLSFPLIGVLYSVNALILSKLWLLIIISTPILSAISVFASMLTINYKTNTSISIILVFPLMIALLILISLAGHNILITHSLFAAKKFIEIILGITFLLLPILFWLSGFLN